MDQSDVTQDRRSRRSHVLLKATLEAPGSSFPVVLRNLSEDGALVSGFKLPAEGARVLFHRQGLSVPSRIAWVRSHQAGVKFDFALFPKELLRHAPVEQKRPPVVRPKRRFSASPVMDCEMLPDHCAAGAEAE